MAVKFEIQDGHGSGNLAKINSEGEIAVVVHPHPPLDEEVPAFPFRQYFTDNGTATGSSDMLVNGSTTNVTFSINAINEYDVYVKSIAVVIVDAGASLNKFGNLTALTNGIEFYWQSIDLGTVIIADSIKTNFEFVRLAGGNPAFGSGTNAFQASNVVSTSEAFLPFIDLSLIFGLPWGIRLRKGSLDKLVFNVRDNVSGLDQFDIIGYGIKV